MTVKLSVNSSNGENEEMKKGKEENCVFYICEKNIKKKWI